MISFIKRYRIKTLLALGAATLLTLGAATFFARAGILTPGHRGAPAAGLFSAARAAEKPVAGPVIDGSEAYHVIVVGGEPEGIAAALSSARNGAKTLLIERGEALGGLMTLGMLNFLDMNHGPKGELLTRGIFEEFYKALGNAFDLEQAKSWFLRACEAEPNLTVSLNTSVIKPLLEGDKLTGLVVIRDGREMTLRALAFIDATTDADIAAAAGVPYTVGGEDYGAGGAFQGVTLVFEVSGVDWRAVSDYLKNDGNPGTGVDGNAAWGYGAEAQKYNPSDENTRFRGPNIARQKNGNVLLNALIIFGVDALDPESYALGIERGLAEIPRIIGFMRENFKGFEQAAFAGAAPRLYVRETRHIIGEYRLTITDVLENRDHWDRIGHGSYPVDIQPTGPGNFGNIIGVPDIYSIPFRCLVPLKVDGLLVAGRSASYDSIPHGSARVIPIGMVTGEACGAAAAYAVKNDYSFRRMTSDEKAIKDLQNALIRRGAYLTEYVPPVMAVTRHWAYSGVRVARELGLTEGGYNNDYRLENPLPNRWALQNKLNRLMSLARARTAARGEGQVPFWEISLPDDDIPLSELVYETARAASLAGAALPEEFAGFGEARLYLLEKGILDRADSEHFPDPDAVATYGQLLYLLGRLYTYLTQV